MSAVGVVTVTNNLQFKDGPLASVSCDVKQPNLS